jgi:hypothetical protein
MTTLLGALLKWLSCLGVGGVTRAVPNTSGWARDCQTAHFLNEARTILLPYLPRVTALLLEPNVDSYWALLGLNARF